MDISMDIAAMSTQMAMQQTATDIGTAVLDNSLDLLDAMGNGMVKMMESSVNPELGQNIDLRV